MGYCTNYTLTVSDRHNEIAEWLDNNESQFWEASEAFQQYGEPRKWYEHDADMITISKVFPDVLFTLHGEGEKYEERK